MTNLHPLREGDFVIAVPINGSQVAAISKHTCPYEFRREFHRLYQTGACGEDPLAYQMIMDPSDNSLMTRPLEDIIDRERAIRYN